MEYNNMTGQENAVQQLSLSFHALLEGANDNWGIGKLLATSFWLNEPAIAIVAESLLATYASAVILGIAVAVVLTLGL